MIVLRNQSVLSPDKVDISLLLKSQDEEEASPTTMSSAFPPRPSLPVPIPIHMPATSIASPADMTPVLSIANHPTTVPVKRPRLPPLSDPPAKKQSKWSQEEDALIIELRGGGMKWEDISRRLPGRSAISCRLHYQNYLERRSEWDEDKKNKLARLYERFKAEMWSKVAEEMAIPWRAAEAMHWQLGEQEMARRAGVVPFSLSSTAIDPPTTRTCRASTSASRPRKRSASRPSPPQLPSVEELTAGAPAYVLAPFRGLREGYLAERPSNLGNSQRGHLGLNIAYPPRTLP